MAIPAFTDNGELPLGVYPGSLGEVVSRFGTGSPQRKVVALRLERIVQIARSTSQLRRLVVFGSFVTNKAEPNDVDVFLIMEDSFDATPLVGEVRVLFDHLPAQTQLGASVFWTRRLACLDGEQAAIEDWQVKRGGGQRGIVEIIQEAS